MCVWEFVSWGWLENPDQCDFWGAFDPGLLPARRGERTVRIQTEGVSVLGETLLFSSRDMLLCVALPTVQGRDLPAL